MEYTSRLAECSQQPQIKIYHKYTSISCSVHITGKTEQHKVLYVFKRLQIINM